MQVIIIHVVILIIRGRRGPVRRDKAEWLSSRATQEDKISSTARHTDHEMEATHQCRGMPWPVYYAVINYGLAQNKADWATLAAS